MASGRSRIKVVGLVVAALAIAAPSYPAVDHRPSYSVRVEQQLQTMSREIAQLEKRRAPESVKPRITEGMVTLREKYDAARSAFRQYQAAPEGEKTNRRKSVDAALVDVQKFYTKVKNRFRG